jgi:hypothetical protein
VVVNFNFLPTGMKGKKGSNQHCHTTQDKNINFEETAKIKIQVYIKTYNASKERVLFQ